MRRSRRTWACLNEVDVEPLGGAGAAAGWLRIAAWSIERGRDPAAIATLIASTGADVALLSEVDIGMGRTGNRDVAREIAGRLSAASVFGVEFVELALGKEADRRGAAATENLVRSTATRSSVASRSKVRRSSVWMTAAIGSPHREESPASEVAAR